MSKNIWNKWINRILYTSCAYRAHCRTCSSAYIFIGIGLKNKLVLNCATCLWKVTRLWHSYITCSCGKIWRKAYITYPQLALEYLSTLSPVLVHELLLSEFDVEFLDGAWIGPCKVNRHCVQRLRAHIHHLGLVHIFQTTLEYLVSLIWLMIMMKGKVMFRISGFELVGLSECWVVTSVVAEDVFENLVLQYCVKGDVDSARKFWK